jgi:bifunctional oligoribonuclease and PAP phosphatase NrnA
METQQLKPKYIAAYEKIKAAKNILLVTHERPDGDGLATLCAMSVFLDTLGKNQTLYCADPAQEFFSFLPNINKLVSDKFANKATSENSPRPRNSASIPPQEGNNFYAFDLIIVLDCGCLARTGLVEEIKNRDKNQFVIEFDHHPKIDDYSDLEIRATKSSAAEVLYHFFTFNNLEINKNIANCLLTGILTDTGNLLFDSVTEETIKISSALLLRGATFPKITQKTLRNKSLGAMKAWGKILDNLKLNEKYNIAFSVLSYEEIKKLKDEFGAEDFLSATDAATDILNNVDSIKAVIFLREEEPGKIRGSLRSKNLSVDVSRLAAYLGGGGHPRAAAFRLPGNIVKTETGWKIV